MDQSRLLHKDDQKEHLRSGLDHMRMEHLARTNNLLNNREQSRDIRELNARDHNRDAREHSSRDHLSNREHLSKEHISNEHVSRDSHVNRPDPRNDHLNRTGDLHAFHRPFEKSAAGLNGYDPRNERYNSGGRHVEEKRYLERDARFVHSGKHENLQQLKQRTTGWFLRKLF